MTIYSNRPETHHSNLELSFVIGNDQYLALIDVYNDQVLQINELHLDQWDGLHQILPNFVTLAQVQQAYDEWKVEREEKQDEIEEWRSQNAAFYNTMPQSSEWSEY